MENRPPLCLNCSRLKIQLATPCSVVREDRAAGHLCLQTSTYRRLTASASHSLCGLKESNNKTDLEFSSTSFSKPGSQKRTSRTVVNVLHRTTLFTHPRAIKEQHSNQALWAVCSLLTRSRTFFKVLLPIQFFFMLYVIIKSAIFHSYMHHHLRLNEPRRCVIVLTGSLFNIV